MFPILKRRLHFLSLHPEKSPEKILEWWCLNPEGNYLQNAFKKPELCSTQIQRRIKEKLVEETTCSCVTCSFVTFWKFILDFQLRREIGEDAQNGCSSNLDKSFSRFDLEIV